MVPTTNSPATGDSALFRRLRVRHLVLLAAIGQTQSLHRAARQLQMTQPGASKLLSEVEKLFGAPLFTRSNRGALATPFGEIVIRRAETILSEIQNAQQELKAWAEGEHGVIRVGVFPVAIPELLVSALTEMFARHPKILISIEEGASETMLPALSRGEFDCLLGRVVEDDRIFDCIPLYHERICVVAGRHHPLSKARRVTLAQASTQEWIFPHSGALLKMSINDIFMREGLRPPVPKVESSSFIAIEALLRRGPYLSLWPLGLANDFTKRRLLKILPIQITRTLPPVGIFLRSGISRPQYLTNFLDCLQKVANQIKSGSPVKYRVP